MLSKRAKKKKIFLLIFFIINHQRIDLICRKKIADWFSLKCVFWKKRFVVISYSFFLHQTTIVIHEYFISHFDRKSDFFLSSLAHAWTFLFIKQQRKKFLFFTRENVVLNLKAKSFSFSKMLLHINAHLHSNSEANGCESFWQGRERAGPFIEGPETSFRSFLFISRF